MDDTDHANGISCHVNPEGHEGLLQVCRINFTPILYLKITTS